MIKLIAAGDIYLGSDKKAIQNIKYDESLKELFGSADLVYANLEGPITNSGNEPINGDFGLYSEFGAIKFLKNYGINLVSLANNHIGDYGPTSVEFTIDFLNENNIRHFGWGKNLNEILQPKVIEIKGIKISLMALTLHDGRYAGNFMPGNMPPEEEFYLKYMKKAKEISDILIVSMHWGLEMYQYPHPKEMTFARRLVDAGADLVLGHHPHVVQGYEVYKNKYIFYSLGNFVFKSFWYKGNKQLQALSSKRTMVVAIDVDKEGVKNFEVIPTYYEEDLSVSRMNKEESDIFLKYFKDISNAIKSDRFNSLFRKYRFQKEFPLNEFLGRLRKEGFSFSIVPRFAKILVKFFKIAVLKR